jgi:putative mRNA 3-end processing factor
MNDEILSVTAEGLYCPRGDFYVDPWRPVARAVITHAHSDHARPGCERYLAAARGVGLLRARLGPLALIDSVPYGHQLEIQGVRISLHPAGHILGSAQVRLEQNGRVCVVSGDYRVASDPTCDPFELVRCHTFVTESTFGLPIYRWPRADTVFSDINVWWRRNQAAGKCSVLFGYSLGKAQRILAGLDPTIGPIFTHGAIDPMNEAYRAVGVALPETTHVGTADRSTWEGAMVIAPPMAEGSPWMRRFGHVSRAFASGWMMIRGTRRRRAIDRGFVLSDHADWPNLLSTISATGAERVYVTHGYSAVLVRWLREQGMEAQALATQFEDERDDAYDAPDAGAIERGASSTKREPPALPLGTDDPENKS